jgi:F0F1-type ATP synthase delta subunit
MAKKLSRKELAATIARLVHDGDTATLAQEVAAYLITERRVKDLDSLMRDVALVRQETYGITEATATTALPLSEEVRRDIKAYLKAPNLVLNEAQDTTLVGGLRLESSDTQLDVSVHDRLRKLKQLVNEV